MSLWLWTRKGPPTHSPFSFQRAGVGWPLPPLCRTRPRGQSQGPPDISKADLRRVPRTVLPSVLRAGGSGLSSLLGTSRGGCSPVTSTIYFPLRRGSPAPRQRLRGALTNLPLSCLFQLPPRLSFFWTPQRGACVASCGRLYSAVHAGCMPGPTHPTDPGASEKVPPPARDRSHRWMRLGEQRGI